MEQRIVRPTPAPTAKTTPETAHFQAGGVLRETSFYVERDADNELFEHLNNGEFCYVLAPRQIGKSSLRVRTRRRLAALGVRCIEIDLTMIGSSGATEDTWFYSIAWALAEGVGDPSIDLEAFWSDNGQLTPVARWTTFLRDEIAAKSEALTVIFLDELDTVLGLPFSADDFFAAIRELYNCRARDPVYERLTFCLLGLADPANLIADPGRTPFNIGRAIALDDFTPEQATVFLAGLGAVDDDPRLLVDAVLAWTDGHPYMTQLLCAELATSGAEKAGPAKERVAALVNELLLNEGRLLNPNLEYAERYLSKKDISALSTNMLLCYRQLLEQPRLESDPSSRVELHLKLAGLAAVRADAQGRRLATRNRIFAEVFDLAWVKEKEAGLHFGAPLQRWLDAPPAERDDLVLRGRALTEAVGSRAKRTDVSAHEEDFLRASQEVARREIEQKAAADLERERRARLEGRMRILILAAAGLLCALGVALWQYRSASAAREAANRAELAERGARAELFCSQSGHEIEGLLLGVSAVGHSGADPADAPPGATAGLVSAVMAARTSFPLRGHTGIVLSAKFSPDGTRILTTSRDRTARLWDVRDGRLLATFPIDPRNPIHSAAFSFDGRHIATARAGDVQLWDARGGQPQSNFAGHEGYPGELRFSADANLLMSWGSVMPIWNVADGTVRATLDATPDQIVGAAFLPDGVVAVTSDDSGFTQIWDVNAGKPLAILDNNGSARVFRAVFSPDGERVVTHDVEGHTLLWNSPRGRLITDLSGRAVPDTVSCAVFSPDSSRVAVANRHKQISSTAHIFNASNGEPLVTLEGHTDDIGHVTFSPDGQRVATASEDGTARLWDTRTGRNLDIIKGHARPLSFVAFSPDGVHIVTASEDKTARVYHGDEGRPLVALHSPALLLRAISPDHTLVATSAHDEKNAVRIWSIRDGKAVATLPTDHLGFAAFSADNTRVITKTDRGTHIWDPRSGELLATMDHSEEVLNAAYSPDGKLVFTHDMKGAMRIWGASDGQLLATLSQRHFGLTFSPDSTLVLVKDGYATAQMVESRTGKGLFTLPGHAGQFINATFSPDGALVATSDGKMVQIWGARSGQILSSFRGRLGAFLPDNTRVLTIDQKAAWIGDARSGKLLTLLEGIADAKHSYVFSPDGGRTITYGWSATAQLLDTTDGKLLATMLHPSTITDVAVSPDGALVVTASGSGTTRLWNGRDGQPIAILEESSLPYYSSLYTQGDYDIEHQGTAAFSPDGSRIVSSTFGRVHILPGTIQGYLIIACQLLRYQPEFAEVESICTPYLDREP